MKVAIVVFAYNRPMHLNECLRRLKTAVGNICIPVYVFSDGSKGSKDEENVRAVRQLLTAQSLFPQLITVYREENMGLAKNIKTGLNDVLSNYDAAIVLEDDILLHRNAVSYFIAALKYYQNYENVFHINGWKHPNLPEDKNCTLSNFMSCWGWATWSEKWIHYSDEIRKELNEMSLIERYYFDRRGSGYFWKQLVENSTGRKNTWAIYWYSIIKLKNAMCVLPPYSLVDNIGFDGSGQNCKLNRSRPVTNKNKSSIKSFSANWGFKKVVELDPTIELKIDQYYSSLSTNFFRFYVKKVFTFLSYLRTI